jgi:hypothetical protein
MSRKKLDKAGHNCLLFFRFFFTWQLIGGMFFNRLMFYYLIDAAYFA